MSIITAGSKKAIDIVVEVLQEEASSLTRAASHIKEENIQKIDALFSEADWQQAKLVTIGVGKSGIIAQKIASTFKSLGVQSFFLHPTEALHGDLGGIGPQDVAIILSNSGTTEEIIKLLPYLLIPKERRIGLLGNIASPLASLCGITLDASVEKEACLNNQAPTTSTTTALALGDALAVLFEYRLGISKEHFAQYHPAGKLGKTLNLQVSHLMMPIASCAQLSEQMTLLEAMLALTERPLGIGIALTKSQELIGILVEGDIRRALMQSQQSALEGPIKLWLNRNPLCVEKNSLAIDALQLMQKRTIPISTAPVMDNGKCIGVIRLHDLLKEGL